MDQAQGLRELKSRQTSTKTFDVCLCESDDAAVLEMVVEALSSYGYQAVIVGTDNVRKLFRPKVQDQLFTIETIKTISAINIHVIFYVRTIQEKKIGWQQLPLIVFVRPEKEHLLKLYQFIKKELPHCIYLIGLGALDKEKVHQALSNMDSSVRRFLNRDVVNLGAVCIEPTDDFVDSVYESASLFVKQILYV
ncbi:hypothetical protein [Shouchella patagoniensis]|uniref:hypothetical protein n=1 Tax=Shouchella patagoniensis TaxID=228576 RepID=UPI000995244A|nr:hypothetical protein [Shouchella patagoniensis]